MKKIFTLSLIAALMFTTASAQSRNNRYGNDNGYQVNQQQGNWNQNDKYRGKDYGYDKRKQRNDDYKRQADYDRMNQQCDQQIEVYRNDRSLNRRERDRKIQQVEYERQQKAKSFGTGVVVGGLAAILLGVLIAHGK